MIRFTVNYYKQEKDVNKMYINILKKLIFLVYDREVPILILATRDKIIDQQFTSDLIYMGKMQVNACMFADKRSIINSH